MNDITFRVNLPLSNVLLLLSPPPTRVSQVEVGQEDVVGDTDGRDTISYGLTPTQSLPQCGQGYETPVRSSQTE